MSDTPTPLDVDGDRPAVAWVTSLPRSYKVTAEERNVLLVLACDSYDGIQTSPGMESLARWSGLWRSSVQEIVKRLEKPTEHRPALIERGKVGRRTVFRLQVNVSGPTGHVTGPATPDTSPLPTRPGVRPATPDTSDPNTSGRVSGGTGHTLSLHKSMHAARPPRPQDETAPPSVDDQLAEIRAQRAEELVGVILEQPYGSRLTNAHAFAAQLRDAGWTAEMLASMFAAAPILGAEGPGLLVARLGPLIKSGPPKTPDRSSTTPARRVCPDHGPTSGICSPCAGEHHGGEHRDHPSPHCHLCTERKHAA